MKCSIIGIGLIVLIYISLIEAYPQGSSINSSSTTSSSTTPDDSDESDEIIAVEVTDGRKCPVDDTTFIISANIPLVKVYVPQQLLDSLNCSTINYCGTGETQSSCPALKSNWHLSYKKALVIARVNSNIPPGLLKASVHFTPKGFAEVKLRYIKFGKVDKIPQDIPTNWNDFSANIDDNKTTTNRLEFESRGELLLEKNSSSTSAILNIHAKRVTDWFKMMFDAEETKGSVTSLEQKEGTWTLFDDKITITLGNKWNREVFEHNIENFSDEHTK